MNEHGVGGQGHLRGGVGECLGEGCVFQAGRACTHEKLEDAKAGLGFTGKGYSWWGMVTCRPLHAAASGGAAPRCDLAHGFGVRKIKRLEGA